MRTRAVLSSIFTSFGILVVGSQLGSAASASLTAGRTPIVATGPTGSATGSTGAATSGPTIAGPTIATPTPTASASSAGTGTTGGTTATGAKDGKYTGDSVGTFFGNVQVAVTISSGKITKLTALQLTNADGRSVQISNYAAPILRSEVLKAQSANVNNVSGATYTTQGYLISVQSALDKAGFTG